MEEAEGLEEEEDDGEIEEDLPVTKYYRSEKVLGQLYRAIDEHAFFEGIQRQSRAARQPHRSSLAEEVWKYVRERTALIEYYHYLPFARDTKDA